MQKTNIDERRRLEIGLAIAAKCVKLHGKKHLPIFQRLDEEYKKHDQSDIESELDAAIARVTK